MEHPHIKPFHFDYKHLLLDEIALEGLEGIGLDLLWRRLAHRISCEITRKMKTRFWNFILSMDCIQFYLLPEPIVRIEIVDRFMLIDEETGQLKSPDDYLDGPYEYCPVEYEYGSCKYYYTRILMPKPELMQLSYDKVESEYEDKMVIVASIEERWRALAGHTPILYLSQLTPIHYCILELVGRSRENGQMTFGVTNITKVVKEPKTLFYNRKHLRDLDLIRVQYITQILQNRGVKSLLLRLKRFHQPKILSMPKVGKLNDIVLHLLKKPDYSEKTDVMINKGMLTSTHSRKLRKTVNIFSFDERVVTSDKKKPKSIKKSFISLSNETDESSQSEEEKNEAPLKCQYKVGVGLLRQAYEQFLIAGKTGLTQVELSQLLGVEFYTGRTICRIFRSKHIVKEFLEDKGRQRKARFIAVVNTDKMDVTFANEKRKFMAFLNESSQLKKNTEKQATSKETPVTNKPPAAEKMDVDNDSEPDDKKIIKSDNLEQYVTEVKYLSGYEHIKIKTMEYTDRNLSLRQLRFANGILKVIKEKLCVCGYQSLSNLVAAETGEPPMYAKCLKSFLQKFVNSGHLKMYKVKWPGFKERYSFFVCAPHISVTDPVIKAKCREINIRAASKRKAKMKREMKEGTGRNLSQLTLPRYMRIQKLHEFLTSIVYFDPIEQESPRPAEGFISLDDFIPEMTVEFALGNITNMSTLSFHDYNMDDLLPVKLKDAPADLYRDISESPSLHITIKNNLKVLAVLGLIQLIYQSTFQTPDHKYCGATSFVFYVNRRAKIIDTTGVWPRPNANIESIEKSFYFGTFEDVKNYWKDVYEISLNTKVNVSKRERKKLTPPLRSPSEVQAHDNGQRYCDGLGSCGFDSCFFMEIPRLWNAACFSLTKKPQSTLKKPKKPVKITPIKRKPRKRTSRKLPKPAVKKAHPPFRRSKKKLTEAPVIWTKEEDRIIMYCMCARAIMSTVAQPGSLKVRNCVVQDILSIKDPMKNKSVCHTRANHLEANSILLHDKDTILNEVRRRPELIQKYEMTFKKIRHRFAGNMSKYVNESKLPMMELVWLMSRIDNIIALKQRVPCVATNIEDFYKKYKITPSSANVPTTALETVENPALKESLILTVMLSFNAELKRDVSKKIFYMLKEYPETTLRVALDDLRKNSVLVVKEKVLNGLMHRFNFEDMVKTSYKISANYQRRWLVRLNSEFVDNIASLMDTEIPDSNIRVSAEITCLLCEMQACDVLDITSSTVPVIIDCSGSSVLQDEPLSVIDIETKYKLKSGTMGMINKTNIKKFSEYKNDYDGFDDALKCLAINAVIMDTKKDDTHMENKIVSYLKIKGKRGSSFKELQFYCRQDTKILIKELKRLETSYIVKRVGFEDNVLILVQFIRHWAVKVENTYIIPTPWLTLDIIDIRPDIFLKWSGVILNKIFEFPGASVGHIASTLEYITARGVQDICMYLEQNSCIILNCIKTKEIDLFSDDEDEPEFVDFNEYASVNSIVASPVRNAFTRYSYLRKLILDKYNKDDEVVEEPQAAQAVDD